MTWPFRTPESASSRASIRPLSSETLSSATEGLLRACASGAPVGLPGDAKARLLAAYERRGGAPSSGLRLVPTILGGLRWQTASLSAAAAAAVVIVVGSLGSGADASRGGLSGSGASLAGVGERRVASRRSIERPLAWERVHPLPSVASKVRVVDDQNLSVIGVGFTPDLDGP